MNEEQLKKDKELLSSWKEKLVYDAPGSCSFCMSEDEGADDIVTLEDCEDLLEAQKRVSEVKAQQNFLMWWEKFYEKEEGKLTMKDAKCILFPKNDETK